MLTVTMLPADQGDCLWVEYGTAARRHHILIDGGTSPTYERALQQKIAALGPNPHLELLIVTHVDTDHIGGVLRMLGARPPGLTVGQVWFNGWRHIAPDSLDIMGPVDGEILSKQLDETGWRWNTSFTSKDHAARLPRPGRVLAGRGFRGGMRLTVVSPGTGQLQALSTRWKAVVEKAGLAPGTPSELLLEKARRKGVPLDLLGADPVRDWADSQTSDLDTTEANGSSIAVLAEYKDEGIIKRCLLAGDAHGDVLAESIGRLARQVGENRLRVDAFKLPHHGSRANVTRELIESVDCRRYLFSTSGALYQHPHREAVARVLAYGSPGASLHFNYRTTYNDSWDEPDLKRRYDYETAYGDGHLTVPL